MGDRDKPLRALIVDDDPVIRLLAGRSLAAIGFAVREAEDGRQGLAEIDRSPPDFVLLDVDMPVMNGFETCAAIRQRSTCRELPVLIATGLADSESIERAFEVGATDFIRKPFDWQILQHRVRFLMRAQGAFSELRRTLADLRDSQQRLANAQRIAHIGNWEWDPESEEMLWSSEVHRIFEIEPRSGAATLDAFLGVVHVEDRSDVEKAIRDAVCDGRAWSLDHRIVTPSGGQRVVRQQAEIMKDPYGGPDHVSGIIQDITERKRAEEQIRYLAYYDSLTGLPNRRMLNEHLSRVLALAARGGQQVALLYLGLDRFKRINDTMGHETGDALLRAVADRLLTCVRASDYVSRLQVEPATVSRLGGDEFTVVISSVRSSDDAAHVARRILEVLRPPFPLNDQEMVMKASLGIAMFPTDGTDGDALLRAADSAMYHAKDRGRGIYRFFNSSMNDSAMRNLLLENGLRAALEREELVMHYQPQCDARTGEIKAVEALARWRSPEFGLVPPSEFVPLAEDTGLISLLGEWALITACTQGRRWQRAGLPPMRVGVNISSHQVHQGGLVEVVERALGESGLDAALLELEITESTLMSDEPAVLQTLNGLKSMGVRLALDDFGTGYSSLSYLIRFPIDVLKIDRSFVHGIGSHRHPSAIVAAVIAMAHGLSLEVTAEGVETAEQEKFLRTHGCDVLQGFRFGHPVEASELEAILSRERDGTKPLDS